MHFAPMHRFWSSIIRPLLEYTNARHIVEIGVGSGQHTLQLLEYCHQHGAVLHTVDPDSGPGVLEWSAQQQPSLVFHPQASTAVLPTLHGYDTVLIDGDHNWYTVTQELRLIEEEAQRQGRFPVVVLHDVDWPYGRRDLYYHPQRIPNEYRHPHSQGGLMYGQDALTPGSGINAKLHHATQAGTPCNGVRTAVEDFLQRAALPLHFTAVAGLHGLGILVEQSALERSEELHVFLQSLALPETLQQHMATLEEDRLRTVCALVTAREQNHQQAQQLSDMLRERHIERTHLEREQERVAEANKARQEAERNRRQDREEISRLVREQQQQAETFRHSNRDLRRQRNLLERRHDTLQERAGLLRERIHALHETLRARKQQSADAQRAQDQRWQERVAQLSARHETGRQHWADERQQLAADHAVQLAGWRAKHEHLEETEQSYRSAARTLVTDLEAQRTQEHTKAAQLQRKVRKLQTSLARLQRSRSWRWTAWCRRGEARLRRWLHGGGRWVRRHVLAKPRKAIHQRVQEVQTTMQAKLLQRSGLQTAPAASVGVVLAAPARAAALQQQLLGVLQLKPRPDHTFVISPQASLEHETVTLAYYQKGVRVLSDALETEAHGWALALSMLSSDVILLLAADAAAQPKFLQQGLALFAKQPHLALIMQAADSSPGTSGLPKPVLLLNTKRLIQLDLLRQVRSPDDVFTTLAHLCTPNGTAG